MNNKEITVDPDTLKLIAAAAAEAAAHKVADQLRAEFRAEFDRVSDTLSGEMRAYFGDVNASQHVVQHARMDRMLNTFDRVSEGIFASILKNVLIGLFVAGLVGYLAWHRLVGG